MRAVTVLEAGPVDTVQDVGRPGLAHLGVPRSGWLDPVAAIAANSLVGNPDEAALLEVVLGGLVLRAEAAITVAVTGASGPLHVAGRAVDRGLPLSLPAGEVLRLGAPTAGLRSYVAVSGGIDVDPVLGSRSTDTLAGIGPARLTAGMLLPLGAPTGRVSSADHPVLAAPKTEVVLACTPGPRVDWFEGHPLRTLAAATYRVQPDSNRVGLRLDGPPLSRSVTHELPSEGIVLGAVQVPADGRPLVFLNDHPTTGGYPVLAVVAPASLAFCAQLRPGDSVRFSLLG